MTITTIPVDAVDVAANGSTPTHPHRTSRLGAVLTLSRRRLALVARTPREVIVPLMAPLLFALVVAPALADTFGTNPGGLDYMTFVTLSTIGLLVPLNAMNAGLGVVVDRLNGARRDLLAAPVPRSTIVAANFVVAIALGAAQVTVLLLAAGLRGADFEIGLTGLLWFTAATLVFSVAMYAIAEVLANRIATQEEYIGLLPAVAIVPYFVAGGLFPLSALPAGLTALGKALPLTHAMALLRYGLLDRDGRGLHDIWGMENATVMAGLSLAVIAGFAALLTFLAMRTFRRAAVS
jgi:ABC-2 type transport system permease protein